MPAPAVVLYVTPSNSDAQALKSWLEMYHIAYIERDLRDGRVIAEVQARYGTHAAPITLIGRDVLFGSFEQQLPELRRLLGF